MRNGKQATKKKIVVTKTTENKISSFLWSLIRRYEDWSTL